MNDEARALTVIGKSARLRSLEARVESSLTRVASAMQDAYLALCEIRDTEAWREATDENGQPVYHTFKEYLADFRASLAERHPEIPVSYSTIWNTLWALRALGDGLGIPRHAVIALPEMVRRELRNIARWDRATGEPVEVRPDVVLPGDDDKPLRERVRMAVENVVAIATSGGEREALAYVRNDLRAKPFAFSLSYRVVIHNGRISAILIEEDRYDDRGEIDDYKRYVLSVIADRVPKHVLADLCARLGAAMPDAEEG